MMLKPARGNIETPLYKIDIYRGQEEDKWDVQKIISHKEINKQTQYKVKQIGYKETTWELIKILRNADRKVKEYYKKAGQVKGRIKG